MSQHSLIIEDQLFPSFRSNLNSALSALATNSAGSTPPTTLYPGMFYLNTSTGRLQMRNINNTAWVDVGTGTGTNLGLAPLQDPVFLGAPKVPTPAPGNKSVDIANTEYIVRDRFQVYATREGGNQTIPTNNSVTVVMNTELVDINNSYDSTTGIFTAPFSGYYDFDISLTVNQANFTGMTFWSLSLPIFINGVSVAPAETSITAITGTQRISNRFCRALAAGNTVSAAVYSGTNGTGGTFSIRSGSSVLAITRFG